MNHNYKITVHWEHGLKYTYTTFHTPKTLAREGEHYDRLTRVSKWTARKIINK